MYKALGLSPQGPKYAPYNERMECDMSTSMPDQTNHKIPSCITGEVYQSLPKDMRTRIHEAWQQESLMQRKVAIADSKLRAAKRRRAKASELESLERAKQGWVKELRTVRKSLNQLYKEVTPAPPETARARPYGQKRTFAYSSTFY